MSRIGQLASWPARDFAEWVALGQGGIRHGVPGWLTVTSLRPLAKLGGLFAALPSRGEVSPALLDLPQREGPRPRIAPHPIPQRQLRDNCAPELLRQLDELLLSQRKQRGEQVTLGISKFERHGDALYVPGSCARGLSRTGEIAHVHHPQGSLHVQLSDGDARLVYERGWGEPHSLAYLRVLVPRTWMFLYLPRNADELQVLSRITVAALDWACGT